MVDGSDGKPPDVTPPLSVTAVYDHDAGDEEQVRQIGAVDDQSVQEAMVDLVSLPLYGHVDLVITTRFDEAVRERSDDPDVRTYFTHRRPGAWVGGKMIPHSRERFSIIIHAQFPTADPEIIALQREQGLTLQRLVRHEGWHAVLYQRVEDPAAQVQRIEGHDENHVRYTSQLLEEFRIERALCEEGWRRPLMSRHDAREVAMALRWLRDPPEDGRWIDDRDLLWGMVMGFWQQYVSRAAVVAAEQTVEGAGVAERRLRSRAWQRLVGDRWDGVLAVLRDVPSARHPTGGGDLDKPLFALMPIVDEWLRHVGAIIEERAPRDQ